MPAPGAPHTDTAAVMFVPVGEAEPSSRVSLELPEAAVVSTSWAGAGAAWQVHRVGGPIALDRGPEFVVSRISPVGQQVFEGNRIPE